MDTLRRDYYRARGERITAAIAARKRQPLTNKHKKWIRYLWLKGVTINTIRNIYRVPTSEIVAIIKMPEDWEALAA